MTKPVEAASFGKEAVDTGLTSLAALSKGVQAIAIESTEYVKRSFEDCGAVWQDIAKANSVERAVEIQSRYARAAYEGFVAQSTKLTGLYADMAKEAYKPFEAALAKSR